MTTTSRTDQASDLKRKIAFQAKLNTDKHVVADQSLAREKLSLAKQKNASCRSCQHFQTKKLSTFCALRDKQIKGYCICHLWLQK